MTCWKFQNFWMFFRTSFKYEFGLILSIIVWLWTKFVIFFYTFLALCFHIFSLISLSLRNKKLKMKFDHFFYSFRRKTLAGREILLCKRENEEEKKNGNNVPGFTKYYVTESKLSSSLTWKILNASFGNVLIIVNHSWLIPRLRPFWIFLTINTPSILTEVDLFNLWMRLKRYWNCKRCQPKEKNLWFLEMSLTILRLSHIILLNN